MKRWLVLLLLLLTGTAHAENTENYTRLFTPGRMRENDFMLRYQLYAPENIQEGERYPLILFFHGVDERGVDNQKQLTTASMIPHYFTGDNPEQYPCFILAPQCPPGQMWTIANGEHNAASSDFRMDQYPITRGLSLTMQVLEEVCKQYPVDRDRLYVTGISMGGYAVWDLITRYPDVFAAAVPICGGCDSTRAAEIASIPIRCYHGARDRTINPDGSRNMFDAMMALGTPAVKYRVAADGSIGGVQTNLDDPSQATYLYYEYAALEHACWDQAYGDPAWLAWLFAQTK